MTTPRKAVHWILDNSPSLSELGSPSFPNDSQDNSLVSTSSLEYINSQLVAHGFAPSPGLSLDGISNKDSERVVKCLFGLLSQRVEDMTRTEELTTRLRTLSYDHERLTTMHRTANEKAANAEREMNLHKSRMIATQRTLQVTENAHKQTAADLQRTRTALQSVRATHLAELKKKEKEIERMSEKWNKIADAQAKLTTTAPSGVIRCANVAVVDGSELIGRGYGFLDVALEEAEKSRTQLGEENGVLRKLVLKAVNEIQAIVYQARAALPESEKEEEPTAFTLTTLFPLFPVNNAGEKLTSVIASLRESLSSLSHSTASAPSKAQQLQSDGELERLQGIITSLKQELELSQKQAKTQSLETQAMFDRFIEDRRIASDDIAEMSVELMNSPLRDEEKERLDRIKKELDQERQKFTEATIKLGREKAALEAERVKLTEEKRTWQVEMMLGDLPPTPVAGSTLITSAIVPSKPPSSPKNSPRKSPHKSPRKSPIKSIAVGKAASRKSLRKHSLASSKVISAFETEVVMPVVAPPFSNMKPLSSATGLLPTFVLPPPSPMSAFPAHPAPSPPTRLLHPLSQASAPIPVNTQEKVDKPSAPSSGSSSSGSSSDGPSLPYTPLSRRLFPVAKPFAQNMFHAYSPAKPSPLSRILMLADSPSSPPRKDAESSSSGGLGVESEEEENAVKKPKTMSLAEELGVSSSPDSPPVQETRNEHIPRPPAPTFGIISKDRVFHPDPTGKQKQTTKNKVKGKAVAPLIATKSKPSLGEKENAGAKQTGKISPVFKAPSGSVHPKAAAVPAANKSAKPEVRGGVTSSTRATKSAVKPIATKGGPRRVLIDSVDAPSIGKGRG